jgi:hypothetical protein
MIEYLTTNVANGHRFVRDHKQHVRWLIDEQEWRVWAAGVLAPIQDRREGDRACQEDPPDDYQQAVAMESDPLRKWATRSHGSQRL